MFFLELKDVIKLYKPENERLMVPALRGVDLVVNRSDLLSIIGPSGSGKSTLLKIIGGIEQPSSGTVEMEDIGIINNLNNKELTKYHLETVGLVYQFPEKNLLPDLSVIANVIFPMKLLNKRGREERKKQALELLRVVDMQKRKDHHLAQLSGGEAQRIAIAIALANDPKLVLADEPTGELDSENTLKVIKCFQDLNQTYGTSFIVVTHDNRFTTMTERTYKIRDGRIYGLYQRSKEDISIHATSHKPESLQAVDNHGTISIPVELREVVHLKNQVIIRVDKIKGILEVLPVDPNLTYTQILLVDSHGSITLPEELRTEVHIKDQVIIRVNKSKEILEIIPVHD